MRATEQKLVQSLIKEEEKKLDKESQKSQQSKDSSGSGLEVHGTGTDKEAKGPSSSGSMEAQTEKKVSPDGGTRPSEGATAKEAADDELVLGRPKRRRLLLPRP